MPYKTTNYSKTFVTIPELATLWIVFVKYNSRNCVI